MKRKKTKQKLFKSTYPLWTKNAFLELPRKNNLLTLTPLVDRNLRTN